MNLKRMIIPSKNIKYIKLCIISAQYEIVVNLVYILTFFLLIFQFISQGKYFSNYELRRMISLDFQESTFLQIETELDFLSYLDTLVYDLYQYDPSNKENRIPIYIPLGNIRLKKYSMSADYCSNIINKFATKEYTSTSETVEVISNIYEDSDSKCGYSYFGGKNSEYFSSKYRKLQKTYMGQYSSYKLYTTGENLDFNIDDYVYDQNKITKFITDDKDIKFIAILFNLYFPQNENYATVIAGVEVINQFSFPYKIFNSSVLKKQDFHDIYFLVVYILFSIAVALNIIKLFYEMNVKFIFSVHLLTFCHEVINLVLIVFISLYFSATDEQIFFDDDNFNLDEPMFHDFTIIFSLRAYCGIIFAFLLMIIPFRFLSLISWYPKLSSVFIQYICVVFRILPGLLINFTITLLLLVVFSIMNFFMYNGQFMLLSNILGTFTDLFNLNSIKDINNSEILDHSLGNNRYFLLYNYIENVIKIYLISILIATITFLLRKSIKLESEKEDNDVMNKLNDIEGKLTNEVHQIDTAFKDFQKQILWLNIGNKPDLFNSYAASNKRLLIFTKSQQIISFLKYLFAIKPYMQFKNLNDKFGIIIQCRAFTGKINDDSLENIDTLLDWLAFVGCKIPILLYTNERLERNLRMKIATSYLLLKFSNAKEDIGEFLKNNTENKDEIDEDIPDKFGYYIKKQISFTLYKVKIIINSQE